MDLTSRYMSFTLKNPLIASASPLNAELDTIRRLEDAGIAAIVLPSIFEEQIEAETERYAALTANGADSFAEAHSYFPNAQHPGTETYLRLIRRASEAAEIPIIASLNGVTDQGWIGYARDIAQAGARGLELNIYFIPTDLSLSGRDVEQSTLDLVRAIRREVSIPIAVKLNPFFSAFGHMAQQLEQAGADALVLFNRLYQADIDLAELCYRKDLQLSTDYEIRLPLLWIALLAGRVRLSLAASTGVEGCDQLLKYLLAGADAVMTTSALLRHGVGHVETMLADLKSWLQRREINSLASLRGKMSHAQCGGAALLARANYIEILERYRPH